MSKEKNVANAKAVFAKNKQIGQLYFTNDGQAFYDAEPAKTHQRELTGSVEGLHLVKNGDYEGTAVSMTEDVVDADTDVKAKKGKKAPEAAEADQ